MRGGGVRAQVSVLSSYTGEGGDADAGRQRGEETTTPRGRDCERYSASTRQRGSGSGRETEAGGRGPGQPRPTDGPRAARLLLSKVQTLSAEDACETVNLI